ncbi:ABC transporter permease [Agrobacterium fabrum]|uniref:ABC transporter, membrane spanning protein (Oligopeptide) n=1 Tax=Agrobacterium fabrum (strain C58 / ATCC 33970) TaxID=176299 RepID=Q7D3I4_AGRFC|nr:ABC transporter, membrane spanning protein (oligopeptide) [Agrobacterium fabrum str. C58]KEY54323.1 peptide ABC transporter permease [Agrobacterium tumefaciens]NMV70641.1 ABC transporter permease [Agrobacterium fabrum]QQN09370.1 ABC transporter permease [Agrobacterium fabrum]QQN14492.1 ABC transporter permease [Agrobacterium fabrum]
MNSSTLRTGLLFMRQFARSPLAVMGLALIFLIVLMAVFAPYLSPQNPYDLMQLDIMDGRMAPGTESSTGFTFLFGSDDQGRDMLSAILYGLRISLIVGLGSAALAFIIGTAFGLTAAYVGGRVETAMMRLVDLQLSFPTILSALLILALLGKSVGNVVFAIVLVEWATYARTARGAALTELRREYVEAARSLRLPHRNILFRQLLPNCLSPLVVLLTMQVARAITLEATLSFLGLGVPVTEPSLGLLISSGYEFILSGTYWIALFPGIALLVTIFAINLVGDRLRQLVDPKAARR